MASQRQSKRLRFKELEPRISLITSVAAFLISVIGLYFGTFYENNALQLTVTSIESNATGLKLIGSLVNAGTKHAVLLDVEPTIWRQSGSEWVRLPYEGFEPVAIPPQDIRVVQIPVAVDFAMYMATSDFKRPFPGTADVEIIIGLATRAMDAEGTVFEREYPVLHTLVESQETDAAGTLKRRRLISDVQDLFAADVLRPLNELNYSSVP